MCAKQEMLRMLERWYGPWDPAEAAQMGLPRDKLDAALMIVQVKDKMENPQKMFIYDHLLGYEDQD